MSEGIFLATMLTFLGILLGIGLALSRMEGSHKKPKRKHLPKRKKVLEDLDRTPKL